MRHMYKVCREYGRRMTSYRGEIARDHPQFAPGSAAVVPEGRLQAASVGIDASDIVYSAEDDKAVETHIKANSEHIRSHPYYRSNDPVRTCSPDGMAFGK